MPALGHAMTFKFCCLIKLCLIKSELFLTTSPDDVSEQRNGKKCEKNIFNPAESVPGEKRGKQGLEVHIELSVLHFKPSSDLKIFLITILLNSGKRS